MSIYVDIEKRLGNFELKAKFDGGDEILALLGASGCGKSMTLKCIAGIEKPDRGRIVVDGETLFDSEKKINLSPQQRRAGLLFQNYALFPNMTALQNIKAGAKREKDSKAADKLVKDIIEKFGIEDLMNHMPYQLSGGQQQRVALARILVSSPRILLLDEPFSALDAHLRFRLEREVHDICREFGKTTLLVSHDRDEVFRMSDHIVVMDGGKIEVDDTRDGVFDDPRTLQASILTGCKNNARLEKIDEYHIRVPEWGLELETAKPVGDADYAGIRMHDIKFDGESNINEFDVIDEIENPFSYTIMVRKSGAPEAKTIGVSYSKLKWDKIRTDKLKLSIPADHVLLLKG